MKYSFESRIRYSEVTQDRMLSLEALLHYFQDCSIFHSENAGVGIDFLESRKSAWVLTSWQVVILRYPRLCEQVQISTWPYEFKRFLGSRNFLMEDENKEPLAFANSLWTYLNMETGLPETVTEEQIEAYSLEEKYPMEYAPRKILLPKETKEHKKFPVRTYHLDTNHHVNNGAYVQMALEHVPSGFQTGELRVEYKKQAKLGDILFPRTAKNMDGYTVILDMEDKTPCAVIELKEKVNGIR